LRKSFSPTGFAQARNITPHGGFAQLVTGKTKLAVKAMRATSQPATVVATHRAGIER
jgi:hypothetical protein